MSRKESRDEVLGIDPVVAFPDPATHQDNVYSYLGITERVSLAGCSRFWCDSYRAAEAEQSPGELLLECLAFLRDERGRFKSKESSLLVRKKIFQVFDRWRQACGFELGDWRGRFSFDDIYFLFNQVSNDCGVKKASLISAKDLPDYERQLKQYVGTLGQLSLWAAARKQAYICQLISTYYANYNLFPGGVSLYENTEDLSYFIPSWRDHQVVIDAAGVYGTQLLTSFLSLLSIDVGSPQALVVLERLQSMDESGWQIVAEILSSPEVFNCFLSKGSLVEVVSLGLRKVQMIRQNPQIQEWDMATWQAFPLEVFDARIPLTDKPLTQDQAKQLMKNQQVMLGLVKQQLPDGGARHKLALDTWYGIQSTDPHKELLHSYHAYTTMLSSKYQFGSGSLAVYLLATWDDPKALLQVPESVFDDRARWMKITSNQRIAQYQVLQAHPNDWRLLCDKGRFDALVAERYALLPVEDDRSLAPEEKPVAAASLLGFYANLKPPTRSQEDELADAFSYSLA
ncbi:MAG: hypothetical protein P1U63_00250 [Coxiellaceae bacterium]|nr:hypothetical protein [Coxiellaceae bacterium]